MNDRKIIKLKVEGFLLGQVVIKFQNGNNCSGYVSFRKDESKSFSSLSPFMPPGKSAEIRIDLREFKRTITRTTVIFDADIAVQYNGMPILAKECSNSFSYIAQMENYHRYIAPKPYPDKLGSSDYYDFRYRESIARHPGIGGPSYYKDFGEKYFNRFMTEAYPKLSTKGQEFITLVGKGLQQAIEDKLKADPVEFAYLELDGLIFKNFAFKTHVPVYCNSGWGNLDNADRNIIKSTVDSIDVLMDKFNKISLGVNWIGIITALQINTCAGIKLPIKT